MIVGLCQLLSPLGSFYTRVYCGYSLYLSKIKNISCSKKKRTEIHILSILFNGVKRKPCTINIKVMTQCNYKIKLCTSTNFLLLFWIKVKQLVCDSITHMYFMLYICNASNIFWKSPCIINVKLDFTVQS